MDNTKELIELLYEKLSVEYEQFINKLYQMEAKEIINSSYEKVFEEDILMCISEMDLPKEQIIALLKAQYPLDVCYSAWLKSDYSYIPDLRDCIENNVARLCEHQKKKDRGR